MLGNFLPSAAPNSSSSQLVLCCQDELIVYSRNQVAEELGGSSLTRLATLPLFEAFRALVRIPACPNSSTNSKNKSKDRILAVSEDGRCLLLSLQISPSNLGSPLSSSPINSSSSSSPPTLPLPLVLQQHACVQLRAPPSLAPLPRREDGICCSPALLLPHSGSVRLALSAYHDIVHVLHVSDSGPQHQSQAGEGASSMSVLSFDLKREALLALQPRE